jgi:hypothetical protein
MMEVFDDLFWDRYAAYTTFRWAEKYVFKKQDDLHWSVDYETTTECDLPVGEIKINKKKNVDSYYNYEMSYSSCRSHREYILFYSEQPLEKLNLEEILQWRYQNKKKKHSYLRSQLGRFEYFNDGKSLRYFLDLTHRTGKLNDFQCRLISDNDYSEETCINVYPAHADKVFVIKTTPLSTRYYVDSRLVAKAFFYKSFKQRIREFQFGTMFLNFSDVGAFPK